MQLPSTSSWEACDPSKVPSDRSLDEIAPLLLEHRRTTMDDSTTTPLSADIQTLTNAHIAEYTALTTRLTYWIYLQWALFAAAGADLILIATLSTPYQAWLLLFILLLIAWGVLYTQDEILSTAVYIEGRLKPAIWTLPGFFGEHANALWRWEEFLIEWRGSGVGKFEQHLGLLPVFAAGILGMFLLLGFMTR